MNSICFFLMLNIGCQIFLLLQMLDSTQLLLCCECLHVRLGLTRFSG